MKQLSESDLAKMIDGNFTPDNKQTIKQVRAELKLGQLIPKPLPPAPPYSKLDLHGKTENQSCDLINNLLQSGARTACIFTGASGILKPKFIDWITNGTLAKYVSQYKQLNNGSFEIKIKKES